ncbi:MAG: SRPBCC domain-containing protein [Parasphingorhabdus sp.]|uniref:SRPBCC family protein n=1 Tax=Parasphingorhabdus sp. TaxID=2709688 RepID=UPI003264021F
MKRLIASFIVATSLISSVPASAEQPSDTVPEITDLEIADADERIILQNIAVISSPVADVWAAFATEDGYKSWAVPVAFVDFRVGGFFETSYNPEAKIGDPANIKNEILAYIPEQLLVLKNTQAPPGFASRDILDRLVSVFQFEALENGQTKITISGIGYGPDEESQRLVKFFKAGNSWSLGELNKMLAKKRNAQSDRKTPFIP